MGRVLHWLACMIPLVFVQCAGARRAEAPAADSGMRESSSTSADASLPRPASGSAGTRSQDAAASRDASSEDAANSGNPATSGAAGQGGVAAKPPATAGMTGSADAGIQSDADSGVEPTVVDDSSCLDQVTRYASAGPFNYDASSMDGRKFWAPKVPEGCKIPVVHFANGTGASCANYQSLLERLASHGFLTVCAENPNTGSGVPGLNALEAALSMYPDLAAHKLGSAGHEAGGQGAILTLQQAESRWGAKAAYAGLAFAPASGHGSQPPSGSWLDAYAALKSPLFLISGSADALVSEAWVGDSFDALGDPTEAYWFSAIDAPHLPIPLDHIQPAAVAWFRWKLLGDANACEYFTQLPNSAAWDARATQNAKACR